MAAKIQVFYIWTTCETRPNAAQRGIFYDTETSPRDWLNSSYVPDATHGSNAVIGLNPNSSPLKPSDSEPLIYPHILAKIHR